MTRNQDNNIFLCIIIYDYLSCLYDLQGAQIGRVSNIGSCTVAQTFWLLLFSTDFLFRVKEGVADGVFAKATQAVLAANFLTFANYMVISIIGLRLAFLVGNKFDSKAFEKNFMGVAEEF